MAQLKNRNEMIPGGFRFRQPQTNWQAPAWQSFDTLVKSIISHRLGNPAVVRKNNLATDYNSVAFEADAFNAKLCEANGWNDFILTNNPDPPKAPPSRTGERGAAFVGAAKRSAAGIKLVVEWLGSGLKPVSKELAEKRAIVCATCPLNIKGNWWQRLESSVADKVKALLEVKHDLNLTTPRDSELGVCGACGCNLALKVFANLDLIKSNMSEETKPKLDKSCWILHES